LIFEFAPSTFSCLIVEAKVVLYLVVKIEFFMSHPLHNYDNDNNDDDRRSVDHGSDDGDDCYRDNSSGNVRFPAALSYHSDAQRSDAATICSGSVHEDIEVESVLSLQDDMQHLTARASPTLASLSRDNSGLPTTGSPSKQHPQHHSTSLAFSDMNPPSNRDLTLNRESEGSSDYNTLDSSTLGAHHQLGSRTGGSHHSYFDDGDDHREQHHVGLPSHPITRQALPINAANDSLNAVVQRYNSYNEKPPAPSSVKSFGSNVGSDDCGGSLDVETHSIGARSILSQEDTLPVVLPDPEPETIAVASLSIDPVDSGSFVHRSQFSTTDQGRSARHLPLQRFLRNRVHVDDFEEHVDDEDEQMTHTRHDPRFMRQDDDHRTPSNWNDPRVDDQLQVTRKRDTTNIVGHPSRCRSPPTSS
jgi:hypothetical protein